GNDAPDGFIGQSLAGVSLVGTTGAQILGSRFSANALGLAQQGGSATLDGNVFQSQTGTGARLDGGQWAVENNTFTGNGNRGLWARLYDAPNGTGVPAADLDLSDDLESSLTLVGNSFGGNTGGGALVDEAFLLNEV